MRDLLISWADNQYSSGMLQEALTSGCLGPTGKLGKNLVFVDQNINLGQLVLHLHLHLLIDNAFASSQYKSKNNNNKNFQNYVQ